MSNLTFFPLATPVMTSTNVALIAVGIALGLLVALLRCSGHRRYRRRPRRTPLINRIVTFFWSVASGVAAAVCGDWLVNNGMASAVFAWIVILLQSIA